MIRAGYDRFSGNQTTNRCVFFDEFHVNEISCEILIGDALVSCNELLNTLVPLCPIATRTCGDAIIHCVSTFWIDFVDTEICRRHSVTIITCVDDQLRKLFFGQVERFSLFFCIAFVS
ncbi:hypothetical protein AR158_c679R [Paramecium bursaria Chlorella virus AR158]|uniref:hypothetical protein n=1 Tax=Paramecium bursaria Chlorella virus AR158 TaxID=380598 RepID=UPI00015AA83A|nr:hypothetical protein AR158_c679R [Paramecium bursaria Chlorella virus AR158]ABU44224.1 hypothetical protein AR158_c679R [Paramecium bursaria Chlorella virus AR158]